jgi:hypothetical protein
MEAKKKRGKPIEDLELAAYAEKIGHEEYRRQYTALYTQTRSKKTFKGRTGNKTKEQLESIKNKYRNGVTMDQIKEMVGL